MVDFQSKKELVFKAIEDTTNTLRYIDTKVASIFIVIGVLASMFIGFGNKLYVVYTFYNKVPIHSSIIAFSVLIYVVSVIISIIYSFKTIKALDNPNNHVNNGGYTGKNLWYLLTGNDNKITINVNDYLNEINSLDEDNYIKVISIELMKVSAIRNIKIENVNKSILWLKISMLSIIVLIVYSLLYYSMY